MRVLRGLAAQAGSTASLLYECVRIQVASMRAGPFLVLLTIVHPLALLSITLGLAAGRDSGQTTRLLIAVLLTSYWGSTIWTSGGVLRRDAAQGTLGRNLASARDARLVLAGKCLGASAVSMITLLITGALLLLVLNRPLRLLNPAWLMAGVSVVAVSGTAIGILLSCVFLVTRHGPQVTSALTYPIFVAGGLLVPPAALPPEVRWISFLISLRWARQFLVDAALGSVELPALGVTLLLTAAYWVLGLFAFRQVVNRARAEGTIDIG